MAVAMATCDASPRFGFGGRMAVALLLVSIIALLCAFVLWCQGIGAPGGCGSGRSDSSSADSAVVVSKPDFSLREFPGFLTPEECDEIRSLASGAGFTMEPSKVYGKDADDVDTGSRVSEQCWMTDNASPLVARISARVADITGTPLGNQESLQVVRYPPGGRFNPHYDACSLGEASCKRMNGRSGPRLYTFLIYLNDGYAGGSTRFTNIDVDVRPAKGKAVLFQNVDADSGALLEESMHAGAEVTAGEKWVANKWVHVNGY